MEHNMATMSFEQLLFKALKNGKDAKSVYDIWLELGNQGTPQDFIDSLKGIGAHVVNAATVTASAWALDSTTGIYKAIIENESVTANDVVNVKFTSDSFKNAITNGVLGYTNTIDGGFEIFANFIPTVDLVFDYVIIFNE
jgi:hypothetical protein